MALKRAPKRAMCVGLKGPAGGRQAPTQSTCIFKIVSENFSKNLKRLLLKIFLGKF